jgi:hypothetical protein
VNVIVTIDTQSNQVIPTIGTSSTAKDNVMDVEILPVAAALAPPSVALQDSQF